MKKFLRVLALFLLPVALLYGLFAAVLVSTRELAGMEEIVAATLDGSLTLYGTSHHENFATYKLRVTSALAPRLLVLGTSRSMQLRGEFFSEKSFYNAGGAVRNMANYEDFLRRLPEEALPETLLVVLDQNMFNTNWRQSSPTAPQDYGELEMDFFDTLLRTGLDYGNRKFSIAKTILPQQGVYGLAAAARGMGFAVDGSYRYGKTAEKNLDQPEKNFADTYRNIDFGELRFAYGEAPDALALSQLDGLLAFCAEKEIRVVGFLPPFPPAVNRRMEQNGGYGYLDTLYEEVARRFAGYGWEFYDFTAVDSADDEYLDGFHGGDRVYAKIALNLSGNSEILSKNIDSVTLEKLLAERGGNPRILP